MSKECEKVRGRLLAFADGDLAGAAAGELEKHVEECSACRREVDQWRSETPRFGEVRMGAAFWSQSEQQLLELLRPPRPLWRRWVERLLAPMPVPRVLVVALVGALAWFAGTTPPPTPAAPLPGAPAHAAPSPAFDVDGISRVSSDLG